MINPHGFVSYSFVENGNTTVSRTLDLKIEHSLFVDSTLGKTLESEHMASVLGWFFVFS